MCSPNTNTLASSPYPGFWLANSRTESSFDDIPVIDSAAAFTQDKKARRELSNKIRDASVNVGFFYLKNHGIREETVQNALSSGKRFFDLPESAKLEIDIHKSQNYKGYTALLAENTDVTGNGDLHEGFDIGWEAKGESTNTTPDQTTAGNAMDGDNVWPEVLPGFKADVLEYYHEALSLGQHLFPLFALALELPEDWFDNKTKNSAAIMRLLHYPPQDPTKLNGKEIGIGTHTDYEVGIGSHFVKGHHLYCGDCQCFTILWQDPSGGLQVQNTSGKWVDAVPIPGTVVVNLGDQFARWTNDVFKSTPHRVINRSGKERYSIPMFFGTDYDTMLEPIETCLLPGSPPHYEVMTAGDYVKSRLDATYAHSAKVPA